MNEYECSECSYIYDEAKGDSAVDIEAGTTFDDLPDDWICPVCGAGKSYFVKI